MNPIVRTHHFKIYKELASSDNPSEYLLRGEWLVTNGLGGYGSSSIAGVTTRKYHALLVAALPPPFGRTVMFNHLIERVILENGKIYSIGCEERKNGNLCLEGMTYLKEFFLDNGLPVWHYQIENILIEKRVFLIYRQNTVYISYRLLSGCEKLRMELQPSFHFRSHEAPVNQPLNDNYVINAQGNRYEISLYRFPPLRLFVDDHNATFVMDEKSISDIFFRIESNRGYEPVGYLWTPGYFNVDLMKDQCVSLIGSTETWQKMSALKPIEANDLEYQRRRYLISIAPPQAKSDFAAELVLAADQFIITPENRVKDAARARALGEQLYSIIAGYHWFTDWGRDTMISLEGLTLCTGRYEEGLKILKTFLNYVRDGLIPNMFPEGENKGLYHTADATLWFFHAIDRYLTITKNSEILPHFFPKLQQIIEAHIRGTHFGIKMDEDSLISQGAKGYQLTWMDAKVGDWVVTPRRGKAVEINALWYNAIKLMAEWTAQENLEESKKYQELSEKIYYSFNKKFWMPEKNYCYDVVDGEQGNDDALRPNQLLAISLKYPVLENEHWQAVVAICQEKLLTPFGLRSLSPDHPDYKARYDGDLRARDAAYHQGTVWAWLIGPFIDAWLKVHPNQLEAAHQFLNGFEEHLADTGVGSINEIFDAIEPYTPRGCIAQAWSVAEVLRCWLKTTQITILE